ncbi:trypsin-like serine protease [Amycolatopsis sp. NBC_00345]|uniref:S1 family peptidase n=1 Tax=Amycolatopsis sp. NBC_00345 TaxID=2975955 RepID=UPI002E25D69F
MATLLLGAATATAMPAPAMAIAGGTQVTAHYPWIASIPYQGRTGPESCGASLIAPTWLLTTGYCAVLNLTGRKARLGSNNSTAGGKLVGLKRGVRYPESDPQAQRFKDIGLIELDKPVANAPVKLGTGTEWDNRILRAFGWGRTCFDMDSCTTVKLRRADIKVLSESDCQTSENIPGELFDGILCLQSGKSATCNGDEGGPVVNMATGKLIGVISLADDQVDGICGLESSYAARVQPYLAWIKSYTG